MADDDFDWVTARSECSIAKVFFRLQAGIRKDVDIQNGLRDKDDAMTFSVVTAADSFAVIREMKRQKSKTIEFVRKDSEIQIMGDDGDPKLVVRLTVDFAGECRLVLNDDDQFSEWHVRKMALERLFFVL